MRWNVKKAAAIGLVVGVIGLLSTLTKENQSLSLSYISMDAIEALTPVAFFAGIAWIRNRFVKESKRDQPETEISDNKQKPAKGAALSPDPRETASFVNYMLMRDDVALYGMPRNRLDEIAAKLPELVRGAFMGAAPLYMSWRLIEYFGSIYGVGFRADATALSSTFLMRVNDTIPDTEEMSEWLRRHFAAMDQAEREQEPVYDGHPVPVAMRVALHLLSLYGLQEASEHWIELAQALEEAHLEVQDNFETARISLYEKSA